MDAVRAKGSSSSARTAWRAPSPDSSESPTSDTSRTTRGSSRPRRGDRRVIAARRDDVSGAVRWFGTAENTALGTDDDLLGVPFHCDAATMLGALGELELAERHLATAQQRGNSYPDRLALTKFILEARRGVRGDVAAQLEKTPPVEAWRVLLVSALAAARTGAITEAQRLLLESERELITLGLSDFKTLGERRAHEELRALLRNAPASRRSSPCQPPRCWRDRLRRSRSPAAGFGSSAGRWSSSRAPARRRTPRRQPPASRGRRRRPGRARHLRPDQRSDLAGRRRRGQPRPLAQRAAPPAASRREHLDPIRLGGAARS